MIQGEPGDDQFLEAKVLDSNRSNQCVLVGREEQTLDSHWLELSIICVQREVGELDLACRLAGKLEWIFRLAVICLDGRCAS